MLSAEHTLANDERVGNLVPICTGGGRPDDSCYASDYDKTCCTLAGVYYSPKSCWHGRAATSKLATAADVSESRAKSGLQNKLFGKSTDWPLAIPRPKFDVVQPNELHHADILFLPHDQFGSNTGGLPF